MQFYRSNRWYRSRQGVFFGVCRGLAEWKGLSVGLVRLLFILSCIFFRLIPVVIVYVLLAIFLPKEPDLDENDPEWKKRFFDNN